MTVLNKSVTGALNEGTPLLPSVTASSPSRSGYFLRGLLVSALSALAVAMPLLALQSYGIYQQSSLAAVAQGAFSKRFGSPGRPGLTAKSTTRAAGPGGMLGHGCQIEAETRG